MIDIRRATVEDVPQVLPMVARITALHEAWDPDRFGFKPNPAEMYRNWMTRCAGDEQAVFLVAQREERLVGFLIGMLENNLRIYRCERFGFIHDVWVEQAYRNEGVGRRMTLLALERFRELGVQQVRLETATANDAARRMFQQCGFRAATVEMLARLDTR